MQAFLLTLACLLGNMSLAQQAPLQASATKTWTAETAREAVFQGVKGYIDTWGILPKDPDYKIHKANIKKASYLIGDMMITNFSIGGYATSKKCSTETLYYTSLGELESIDLKQYPSFESLECPSSFPSRAIRYSYPEGKLINAVFVAEKDNQFLYEPDGSLVSHWIKNKGFDAHGHFFGTRISHIERTISNPH